MFHRLDRGDDHHGARTQSGGTALDMEKLFGAKIGTETSLGYDIITELERGTRGDGGIGALGNVGKGTTVYEGGSSFE